MPISKEDALAVAAQRDAMAINELCTRLDEAIMRGADTSTSITVSTMRTPAHIVQRVIEIYTEIGWQCSSAHDVREGDSITLA